MSKNNENQKVSTFNKVLNALEAAGNLLPHPIVLFAIMNLIVIVLSAICSALGVSATGNMVSGAEVKETTVTVVNLLSKDGLAYIFSNAITNFTSFAPVGVAPIAMLGVGLAESSGLIDTLLKFFIKKTPKSFVTPMVIFLGVMANIASDAGYVVLVPLGAMIFRACGRHPIAGLAAAFAGVSGGWSANLLIGVLDPLIAAITQTAAAIIDPTYEVAVLGNYFFMAASTFLVTFLGTVVNDTIIEPRLGTFGGEVIGEENQSLTIITEKERKGVRNAGIALLTYVAIIVALCIPSDSFFRNVNGSLLGAPKSPFINSVIMLMALMFFIPAVAYGKTAGTFKDHRDVCNAMGKAMSSMGSFLALCFVAAQFTSYFSYTKLGTVLALNGAELIKTLNIGMIPLMIIFVLLSSFVDLFMSSATAKWNVMAPVFVPMFMLLGYSPELCQLVYRIGDSCANIMSPLATFFPMVVVFAQKYDKDAGVGTILVNMLPYAFVFLFGWTLMLVAWLALGLPIGIGTSTFYPAV